MRKILNIAIVLLITSTITIAQTFEAGGPEKTGGVAADTASSISAPVAKGMQDTARAAEAPPARPSRKSVRKAFFMSLVVPGTGEYYVGKSKYAKGFLASEALIWSFALFSGFQGKMWKDDYIGFAAQEAGANPEREEDQYYEDMYEWPNSEWYNEYQWAEARDLYPDDPEAQAQYVSDKLYPEGDAWEWQSLDEWNRYRNLRVKSQNAYRRITYAVGAAVLNHLLSAVNAARLAKSHNAASSGKKRLTMDFNVRPLREGGLALTLNGRF